MAEYSLHTGVEEQSRTLEDVGFGGMSHHDTSPNVNKEPGVPYNKPSPLENHVNPSSDTQKGTLPAPSGTLARRTS